MPFDLSTAPSFALLAMYAEDMHDMGGASLLVPQIDRRIEQGGWTPRALLAANDSILPANGGPLQLKPERLCYRFVAQSATDPSSWVVAVRGTAGIAEWIIDGQFFYTENVRGPGTAVEHGFWSIYSTMALTALDDGSTLNADAAAGIAGLVGDGAVTIVGHSLGSALATYLSFDIAARCGDRVSAFMFASPRTGNDVWAALYHAALQDRYRVVNYILDLVPRLPARPQYVDLQSVLTLLPSNAQAGIKVEVRSNHHVLCYCAMLSYACFQDALPDLSLVDRDSRSCVLGDQTTVPLQAKLLEKAVQGVEIAGLSVSKLFRAMLDFHIDEE